MFKHSLPKLLAAAAIAVAAAALPAVGSAMRSSDDARTTMTKTHTAVSKARIDDKGGAAEARHRADDPAGDDRGGSAEPGDDRGGHGGNDDGPNHR